MKASSSVRGSALWVALLFIALIVGLVAAGYPVYTKQKKEIEELNNDLIEAHKEVRELKERPTREELLSTVSDLQDTKARLATTQASLEKKSAAYTEAAARAKDLSERLAELEDSSGRLTTEVAGLRADLESTTTERDRLHLELKNLEGRYENARRAASGKEELLDDLDTATAKIAQLESDLEKTSAKLSGSLLARNELENKLADANETLVKKEELLDQLRKELADIPLVPLPEELAEAKYREYLNKVAAHTDRESRVSMLFRAKLVLAGSEYEDKADSAWRRELRAKQEDVDRAARAVYDDIVSKMRLHPEAHDENVNLLEEALEKVRNSKYEKVIEQLIDREHELKAQGR